MNAKKSEWWQYWELRTMDNGEKRVFCNYCPTSYKHPATTNMATHTTTFHPNMIKNSDQSSINLNAGSELEIVKVRVLCIIILLIYIFKK